MGGRLTLDMRVVPFTMEGLATAPGADALHPVLKHHPELRYRCYSQQAS